MKKYAKLSNLIECSKNEKFNFSIGGETSFVVEYADTNGFGGIATSGWKGRSFSMGIADSVTVIAENASVADAAATIIGNHIDLKNSNKVKKTIANNLYEDTDLNNKLITVSVENLTETEIRQAISKGKNRNLGDEKIHQFGRQARKFDKTDPILYF